MPKNTGGIIMTGVAAKLLKMQAEKVIEGIANGTITPEEASQFVNELYDGTIGNYKGVIKLMPEFVEKLSNDLIVPLHLSLLKIMTTGLKNADIDKARTEYRTLLAKNRSQALKIYIAAGFKRNEAMALILQDAANTKAFRENITTSINSKKS